MSRSKADNDLYGAGLLGETLAPQKSGAIAEKFMVAPFSVLSARDGYWQDRKRAWISMGIRSELGRGTADEIDSDTPVAPGESATISVARPPVSERVFIAPAPKLLVPKAPAIIHEPPKLETGIEVVKDWSSLTASTVESKWFAPAILPTLPRTGRIAVDVETKDPQLEELGPGVRRPGNYVVGLAVGTEDGRRWYFPMRHEGGGNLDEDLVWAWAREELNAFRGTVAGANLSYDLDWLAENGVTFPLVDMFDDVQIAEPLIDEWRYEFNLDALAKDYLGERKVDSLLAEAASVRGWKTAKEIKGNLWRLPAAYVGPYAEGDVDLPLRILPLQIAKIEAEEGGIVWDIERRLVKPLVEMTRRGVRVDVDGAVRTREGLDKIRNRLVAEVRRHAGPQAEINIPDSFVAALRANGHTIPLTEKTKVPSIRKEWLLARLSDPLCSALFNARKVSTLISTFLDGNILGSNINGRIHCTWRQLKGDDGGTIARTASANPNLANIPGRDEDKADEDLREIAPLIRGLFVPEEGERWGRADLSQIEYRLLAHFAVGPGSEEVRRTYNEDPKTDYHKLCATLCGINPEDKKRRKMVKGVNFARTYGAQANKLALLLGVSKEEATAFTELYDEKLPFNRATFDAAQRYAEKHGFVRSILRRRQHFNLWEPRKKNWGNPVAPLRYEEALAKWGPVITRYMSYAALNRKMQASNADIIKKIMVDGHVAGLTAPDALGPYLVTVYDELGCSVPQTNKGADAWRALVEIMKTSVPLKVPVLVDDALGANWGECM